VRAVRGATVLGSALAVTAAVAAAVNLRRLRVPPAAPPPVAEPVSVLLPLRNEAARVEPCLRALLAQVDVRDMEVIVLDDASTDDTQDVVRRVAGADPRVRLLSGKPLADGWWGKPWACQQLADEASGRVLVFLDADVELAPHAVAAAVTLLRWTGLHLVSPYPRQVALSPAERLLQPLLQWSILSTLPLRTAERSSRPSLSAANGQFLVVDAAAYRTAGGHGAVRGEMLEDIALLRAVKRSGGRGVVVDGTTLATCRMYDGWPALREGYAKSLWSAFGSDAGRVAVTAGLLLAYVLPPVAALGGSRAGQVGYAAGVAGRVLVGRRTGGRVVPDAFAHPVSVAALCWLAWDSATQHRRGEIVVRGRRLRAL
jgi:glycosyl transferase family 2